VFQNAQLIILPPLAVSEEEQPTHCIIEKL